MQLVIDYSLKIATVIFGLLFHKLLWLLAFFYVVAEVDDFGRTYTSLAVQDNSDGC